MIPQPCSARATDASDLAAESDGVALRGVTEIWGHISVLPPLVYVPAACQRPGLISWITEIKQRGRGAEERESAVPLQEDGMKGAWVVKWGQQKTLCNCLRVRRGWLLWFLVHRKWKMCRGGSVDTAARAVEGSRRELRVCAPQTDVSCLTKLVLTTRSGQH